MFNCGNMAFEVFLNNLLERGVERLGAIEGYLIILYALN